MELQKLQFGTDKLSVPVENNDETGSARTEDFLLSTRSNSESTSISKKKSCCKTITRKCCSCCGLSVGILLTTLGILMLIWAPFDVFMNQRLDMIPGLPAYDWWKTPPDEVYLRVYIFNVTNSEAFLNGSDSKINLEEIGPIVYLEKYSHHNVTHNDNGTLSYTIRRNAVYLPEENTIDYNATIIVPNYAILGTVAFLHDARLFTKIGFNILLRGLKSPLFIKTTIYNYLWNLTDPLTTIGRNVAPHLLSSDNLGMLQTIYENFVDTITVYTGPKNGHHRFFLIDKFDGSEYLVGHGPSCHEKVVNTTEGTLYPQYLTRNVTLKYYRKTLCRVIPLVYEKDQYMDDFKVLTYKFTKPAYAYNREKDLSRDCHKGNPVLPSGISDCSQCYNGIKFAASFPHFLFASEGAQHFVTGLKPNKSIHQSYTYVEPLTGIPVRSVARSQSNIVIPELYGFSSDVQKFSNIIVPMFWLEFKQDGLPYYVKYMLQFTVIYLPKYQYVFVSLVLILGILFLVLHFRRFLYNDNNRKKNNYKENTNMQFEKETFLKC